MPRTVGYACLGQLAHTDLDYRIIRIATRLCSRIFPGDSRTSRRAGNVWSARFPFCAACQLAVFSLEIPLLSRPFHVPWFMICAKTRHRHIRCSLHIVRGWCMHGSIYANLSCSGVVNFVLSEYLRSVSRSILFNSFQFLKGSRFLVAVQNEVIR